MCLHNCIPCTFTDCIPCAFTVVYHIPSQVVYHVPSQIVYHVPSPLYTMSLHRCIPCAFTGCIPCVFTELPVRSGAASITRRILSTARFCFNKNQAVRRQYELAVLTGYRQLRAVCGGQQNTCAIKTVYLQFNFEIRIFEITYYSAASFTVCRSTGVNGRIVLYLTGISKLIEL